jgi:hypothetical protein
MESRCRSDDTRAAGGALTAKQASGTLAHCFTASSSASASAFFPAFPSLCSPQYLHLPGLTHQLKPTMSCTPSGLNLHLGHGNIICEPPAPEPPKRSRAAPVAEPRWHRSQKDHGDIIAGRDQQIPTGTGKRRTVSEIHEFFMLYDRTITNTDSAHYLQQPTNANLFFLPLSLVAMQEYGKHITDHGTLGMLHWNENSCSSSR